MQLSKSALIFLGQRNSNNMDEAVSLGAQVPAAKPLANWSGKDGDPSEVRRPQDVRD